MNIKKIVACFMAAQMALSGVNVFAQETVFDDIEKTSELYGAAKLLKGLGIIEGVGDNKFAPENTVTRADFAVMIDKAIALENSADKEFYDVPEDSYFAESVKKAAAAGIIKGDENGSFNPYKPINKQEAAVILTKAYESVIGKAIFAPNAAKDCSDYESVATWAKTYIDKAVMTGMISVDENVIGATEDFSRADTALSISKLILTLGDREEPDTGIKNEIEQWNKGNIFVGNETMGFTLVTGNDVVEYVVTDYYNKIVEKNTVRVEDGKVDLTFPDYEPGYYEVGFYGADSEGIKSEILRTSMCYFEDYDFRSVDQEESCFAMNMHCDRGANKWSYDLLDQAEIIGVKHIRDSYEWRDIERVAGNYTPRQATIQNYMDSLKEHNMSIIITTGFNNPLYDNDATPYTDAGRKAYALFSKSFFDLYGTEQSQDIYNEWFGLQFGDRGNGPADSLPEYYVPLLKEVYTTIKAEYPDVILNFCVGHNEWYEEMVKMGALDYCDIINTHHYSGYKDSKLSLEETCRDFDKHLKDVILKYAPDKIDMPIWVTETGRSTSTNSYGNPEKVVAQQLPRMYAIWRQTGATRIYYYDLLDDGNTDGEHEDRFGLMHAFGSYFGYLTPKPSYVSMGAMARILTGEKLVEFKSLDNGIEWNHYNVYGKDVHMFNTRGIPAKEDYLDVAVYADGDVNVIDIMGVKRTYTPVDGKIYLTLNGDPIYLEGNITDVKEEKIVELKADDWIPTGKEYGVTVSAVKDTANDMKFNLDDGKYSAGETMMAQEFYTPDTRKVVVEAEKDGKLCGRFIMEVTSQKNYEASIDIGVEKNQDASSFNAQARIDVTNNAPYEVNVNNVLVKLDGKNIEMPVNQTIAANEKKNLKFDLGEAILGTNHTASVRVCMDGILSDETDASGSFNYNAINRKTIVIDGVLDEGLDEVMSLTTQKNGEMFRLDSAGSSYSGDEDLSGTIWITYDDEYLYVSADITDDQLGVKSTGENIWRNDCLQIDFSQHETAAYAEDALTEVGIGLQEDGSTAFWAWRNVIDIGDTANPNGMKGVVTRNGNHTIYEAAISWKETAGIDINNISRIDISIAINDNDNNVRKTAIEVGGGIIYGKDPSKYNKYSLIR